MASNSHAWVISGITATPAGRAVYEVVDDRLQRYWVTVPYRHTDDVTAAAIIAHTVAAHYAPPRPFH